MSLSEVKYYGGRTLSSESTFFRLDKVFRYVNVNLWKFNFPSLFLIMLCIAFLGGNYSFRHTKGRSEERRLLFLLKPCPNGRNVVETRTRRIQSFGCNMSCICFTNLAWNIYTKKFVCVPQEREKKIPLCIPQGSWFELHSSILKAFS